MLIVFPFFEQYRAFISQIKRRETNCYNYYYYFFFNALGSIIIIRNLIMVISAQQHTVMDMLYSVSTS